MLPLRRDGCGGAFAVAYDDGDLRVGMRPVRDAFREGSKFEPRRLRAPMRFF